MAPGPGVQEESTQKGGSRDSSPGPEPALPTGHPAAGRNSASLGLEGRAAGRTHRGGHGCTSLTRAPAHLRGPAHQSRWDPASSSPAITADCLLLDLLTGGITSV